jgi:Fe2+ or Zn2+ uptake regulation protein
MTTKLNKEDIIAVIEDSGHRLTYARRSIVAFSEGKYDGFTAEEINSALPLVGRATIYRTLKLLIREGLLCKLFSEEGHPKYTIAKFGHHHHTICARCGKVGEFRDSTVERLLKAINQDVEGDIVGHKLELYIVCLECKG